MPRVSTNATPAATANTIPKNNLDCDDDAGAKGAMLGLEAAARSRARTEAKPCGESAIVAELERRLRVVVWGSFAPSGGAISLLIVGAGSEL